MSEFELDAEAIIFREVPCPDCKGRTMSLRTQLLLHESGDKDKAIARAIASCPCGFVRHKDFPLTEEVQKIFTSGGSKEMDEFMLGLGFRLRKVGHDVFAWSRN